MKRYLFILNAFYPYENGESFLANEIDYLGPFARKIICPIYINSRNSEKLIGQLPENTEVIIGDVFNRFSVYIKYFFICTFSKIFYNEIYELFKSRRISIHNICKCVRFIMHGDFIADCLVKYVKSNNIIKKDILLYSYWMNLDAYIAAKIKTTLKLYKIKCVSRCHRVDIYEYTDSSKYIPMRRFIFDNMDKIFPISSDGYKYMNEKYGLSDDLLEISRLGTYDKGINISKKGRTLKIVSCSWLRKVKRVDLIIQAIKNTIYPIIWTHFGNGDQYNKIQNMIQSIDNPNLKCILKGSIDNQTVLEEYRNEDYNLFVNVSENEGVPVSIMEAMSFGKLIVATDVGGTSEIVNDGINGYLLEKNFTVSKLTEIFDEIYRMPINQYYEMSTKSREIWEQRCDAKKNYNDFNQYIMKQI